MESFEREKKTKSGPLLEVDFYPVFEDGRRLPTRPTKTKRSTKEQAEYNRRQAEKKIVRLVNANFGADDYFMHPTYEPAKAPQNEKEARRDIVNYIRRVKTRRAAELRKVIKSIASAESAISKLPDNEILQETLAELKKQRRKLEEPLKYVYVIEKQIYKTGIYSGRNNWHFHLFITGGLSDRELEKMWTNGLRTNANNFQPEKFGPEAAAKYMVKDPQGSKRFVCSRNLKKPSTPPPKDGKITRRGVERMAKERVDDREYWEKRYKGYRFVKCYARYNNFNGYWYVSVVMYKTAGAPPKWDIKEWLEE